LHIILRLSQEGCMVTSIVEYLSKSHGLEVVPRETWDTLLKSQAMKNPTPRI
jgi:hypothetical protein